VNGDPNLRALKPSRKRLRAGDVFSLSPRDGLYLFGRIISTEAVVGPMQGLNLIYLYDVESDRLEPPPDNSLTVARLLVPPMMIIASRGRVAISRMSRTST
jgi:hypothetical protein